jgi:hypothetical protein
VKRKVVVVVNKWWECDPLMYVLTADAARPARALRWPSGPIVHQRPQDPPKEAPPPTPRATFELAAITVDVWCVSDLMEHLPDNLQSNSEAKAGVLPRIVDVGGQPDLVLAVGTAAYPRTEAENGSVVVGSRVFMHDSRKEPPPPGGQAPGPPSNWEGPFDHVIDSSIDDPFFNNVTSIETYPESVLNRFVVEPVLAAGGGTLMARRDFVALGTVNVSDSSRYKELDPKTVEAFCKAGSLSLARSVETTHGLIRVLLKCERFMFVSGISNRVGHYGDEVKPREYAQNFAAAHNAGVVVAWMLPRIDAALTAVD